MLTLSLAAVARGEVEIREVLPADDPRWEDTGLAPLEPLQVDLRAFSVGEGVLVRGQLRTRLQLECRRCLTTVDTPVETTVDVLYEELKSEEEEQELSGEVYPLPARGDTVDLWPALREQLLLNVPVYVVCQESCRGLCPQCGTDLNQTTCSCVPERAASPWSALKDVKFD